VGLMISFKFMLCSLMHWRKEDGWFPRNLWVLQNFSRRSRSL
jgi:hypothetical protein